MDNAVDEFPEDMNKIKGHTINKVLEAGYLDSEVCVAHMMKLP
jgi:hypothetical protein